MSLYYEDSAVQIYLGDCREILPSLPKVDLVLTDPPYGINYVFHGGGDGSQGSRRLAASPSKSKPMVGDDAQFDPSFLLQWPCLLWGANYYSSLLPLGRWLVWDKHCEGLELSQSSVEFAWCSVLGPSRIHRQTWQGFIRDRESGSRVHPTQKPIELMRWSLSFLPDGTILDPFMGSGTTLRAAKDLGRKAIGIEIEEKYCEIAAKRMSQEVLQFA